MMGAAPELMTQQATSILHLAGRYGPVEVTHLKRANDIWRLRQRGDTLFLKVYTKDWYGGDPGKEIGGVRHEQAAYTILAAHDLPTPPVVMARVDGDNPLGRPFLLLGELAGASLVPLLRQSEATEFAALLEATGDYLRWMHAITFRFPGYLMEPDGPQASPQPDAWQHPIWTAERAQREALTLLDADRPRLSRALSARLESLFATLADALAPAYRPPRFVHGDCHAEQFFLARCGGAWQVTGVVDMEVSSAGAAEADFAKVGLEMMCQFPPETHWWEPLFAGYGGAPEFERLRLWLLSMGEPSFKAYGADKWPATREATLEHLLAAHDWRSLFTKP
jgi:aminoglycoside phosphotransferase (APT) family kinase protein